MADNIQKMDLINVDLNNGTVSRSFMNRTIGEGDILANRFGVRVLRDGEAVDLTGATCNGYFIRSDGATVAITGSVSGNVAYVELPQTCYAVEGQFALAIKLTGEGVTGTMRIIDGVVENTTTGSAVDPGTIIPNIETLIAEIEAAVNSIPEDYSTLSNHVQYNSDGMLAVNPTYYQQAVNGETGAITDSDVQIRSQFIYVGKGNTIYLNTSGGYRTHIRWYNKADATTFVSGENSVSGFIDAPADYAIVVVTEPDWGNITPSEGIYATTNIYKYAMKPQAKLYTVAGGYNIAQNVNVDLINKIIRFGNATSGNGRVYLNTGTAIYNVGNKSIDYSDVPGEYVNIYFQKSTETFVANGVSQQTMTSRQEDFVYVGTIWGKWDFVKLDVIPYFYVNGIKTLPDNRQAMFSADRSYGYSDYNMAVLGDSTSSYDGISESTIGGRQVRSPYYPYNTVDSSDKMWWAILRKMLRFGGAVNVSSISRSRYLSDIDNSEMYAPALWNTDRIARLSQNSNLPHYIFILGGINDGYTTDKYGAFGYHNQVSEIVDEPVTVARGIELTIRRVQEANPNARIVLITPWAPSYSTSGYDWESYYKTCDLIEQIGKAYCVYCTVDLRKSGIHQFASYYLIDGIHPNALGMEHIAAYVYDCMTSQPQPIYN